MRCYDIEGQTAIVTGTSSGLGVCFAEALAECGVNLVIAARRNEKLVKVAEDLTREYGVKVVPLQTDVSQEDQVIKMVKTAVDGFGSLQIIVNNAGIGAVNARAKYLHTIRVAHAPHVKSLVCL
jgi:short-subunit dehydrogenase